MAGRYDDIKEPKHHPSDVRFYLAYGVLGVVGIVIIAEVIDVIASGCNQQSSLDAWGLFDAALFAIASAIVTYYFVTKND